jgi:hypothetical protein
MDVERETQMDQQTAQDRELDEALAQARAPFAGMSDEQILDEVSKVVDCVRAQKRTESPSPTSA